MISPLQPNPPHIPDADRARVELQLPRRQILLQDYGDQPGGENNIRPMIDAFLGPERADLIAQVDFSNNPLLTAARQLSTPGLYHLPPSVGVETAENQTVADAVAAGKYWLWMQKIQFLAVGIGDAFLHVQLNDGTPLFREVPAHHIFVETASDDPAKVLVWRELRLRDLRTISAPLGLRWCFDVYDLRDGGSFYIEEATADPAKRTKWTALLGPDYPSVLTGADYRWRWANGTPYAPYLHYALSMSGEFWSTNETRGLTRATMLAMAFSTMANQSAMDASHSTALVFGAIRPSSPTTSVNGDGSGGAEAARMAIHPGTILFLSAEDGVQPSSVQLRPSADLAQLRLWMASQESGLLSRLGLAADDVQFTAANPTSAGSLAIRNRAKRQVAERMAPYFRSEDLRCLAMVAAMLGAPETGYTVSYQRIPDSPEDEKATSETDEIDLRMGLTSRVQLYMRRHPGMSRADAIRDLQQIQADEAALGPPVAAISPTPAPAAAEANDTEDSPT